MRFPISYWLIYLRMLLGPLLCLLCYLKVPAFPVAAVFIVLLGGCYQIFLTELLRAGRAFQKNDCAGWIPWPISCFLLVLH